MLCTLEKQTHQKNKTRTISNQHHRNESRVVCYCYSQHGPDACRTGEPLEGIKSCEVAAKQQHKTFCWCRVLLFGTKAHSPVVCNLQVCLCNVFYFAAFEKGAKCRPCRGSGFARPLVPNSHCQSSHKSRCSPNRKCHYFVTPPLLMCHPPGSARQWWHRSTLAFWGQISSSPLVAVSFAQQCSSFMGALIFGPYEVLCLL